jgi:ornithine carbamoyltransferase
MIFEKPSLRTRTSFEMAMVHLGGHALYLSPDEIGLGARESVADVARVLSRYVDGIEARVYTHRTVEELAAYATVPVINGLSDWTHPCQALGDALTIWEHLGTIEGQRVVFVGDGNNVANSLLFLGGKLGMHVTVATPPGYEPHPAVLQVARDAASVSGAQVSVTNDPVAAVERADIVYTDVWTSMGQEDEAIERRSHFTPYQVNAKLMSHAPSGVRFMHCLPAHRGEEVTSKVADALYSIIFDQAENRLHAQKAVLAILMA